MAAPAISPIRTVLGSANGPSMASATKQRGGSSSEHSSGVARQRWGERKGDVSYSRRMPRLRAMVTACVRSAAASLARIELTWVLTVPSLMDRTTAISLLPLPSATSCSTWIFAARQSRSGQAICEFRGDQGGNDGLPLMHGTDALQQVVPRRVLEKVGLRARSQTSVDVLVLVEGREYDEASRRDLLSDRRNRLHPVHLRHPQVQQSNIRAVAEELLHGFPAVAHLGDHHHVRPAVDQRHQPFAYHGVVIGDKDPHTIRLRHAGAPRKRRFPLAHVVSRAGSPLSRSPGSGPSTGTSTTTRVPCPWLAVDDQFSPHALSSLCHAEETEAVGVGLLRGVESLAVVLHPQFHLLGARRPARRGCARLRVSARVSQGFLAEAHQVALSVGRQPGRNSVVGELDLDRGFAEPDRRRGRQARTRGRPVPGLADAGPIRSDGPRQGPPARVPGPGAGVARAASRSSARASSATSS